MSQREPWPAAPAPPRGIDRRLDGALGNPPGALDGFAAERRRLLVLSGDAPGEIQALDAACPAARALARLAAAGPPTPWDKPGPINPGPF